MAVNEKIRVKIRSYEHTLADQAAAKIPASTQSDMETGDIRYSAPAAGTAGSRVFQSDVFHSPAQNPA